MQSARECQARRVKATSGFSYWQRMVYQVPSYKKRGDNNWVELGAGSLIA